MHHFLEKIKHHVQMRVDRMSMPENLIENTFDFCDIFSQKDKPCVIAEIKFATPAAGRIYPGDLSHCAIAQSYLSYGAKALSVLAEPDFFQGDIQYIREIRRENPCAHLLLKDFILSEKQIAQGLMFGANAVLLIAAFLSLEELKRLYVYAVSLGLTPILEIHDALELDRVLALEPRIIGINNRNLKTLEIDMDTSRQLIKKIPHQVFRICESGIQTSGQFHEMTGLGFNGFLIGSQCMRHADPGKALDDLLKGSL